MNTNRRTRHFQLKRSLRVEKWSYAGLSLNDEKARLSGSSRVVESTCLENRIVIPKKFAKHAVRRNSLRRLIACRLLAEGLYSGVTVRLIQSFSQDDYLSAWSAKLKSDVQNELLTLFN